MYAEERQHEIVTRARELGRVSVAELAARYDVTPETIRRDLDALAGRGLVSRVHGGAVPADRLLLVEPSVTAREVSSPEEKLAIAQKAIGLLPHREGLTVLVDAGTTTGHLCGLLPTWVGLVVTNSVPAAAVLSQQEGALGLAPRGAGAGHHPGGRGAAGPGDAGAAPRRRRLPGHERVLGRARLLDPGSG